MTSVPDGGFLVSGTFTGEGILEEGEPDETVLISGDGKAHYVARYGSDGDLAWAMNVGAIVNGVWDHNAVEAFDQDDGFVLDGDFNGTATFGEDEPTEAVIPDGIFHTAFTALYGPNGDFHWVVHHGQYGDNRCRGVDTLGDDTIFSTGGFWGEDVAFGTSAEDTVYLSGKGGTQDIYVTRMDRVQAPR